MKIGTICRRCRQNDDGTINGEQLEDVIGAESASNVTRQHAGGSTRKVCGQNSSSVPFACDEPQVSTQRRTRGPSMERRVSIVAKDHNGRELGTHQQPVGPLAFKAVDAPAVRIGTNNISNLDEDSLFCFSRPTVGYGAPRFPEHPTGGGGADGAARRSEG